MKNIITLSVGLFVLAVAFSCYFSNVRAQEGQEQETAETEPAVIETSQESAASKTRANFVKVTDFYLKDDKLVSGKLVSEDKYKITMEQLEGNRIVASTYSKKEINTKTLQTRTIPEYRYYTELAEYFAGRTWDFRDDPDDFLQAIRCYEKAKESLVETQGDQEKINEIKQNIDKLKADRDAWIKEAETRAKLKKLESVAAIESRIKELEDKVNANSQQLEESMGRLDNLISAMEEGYQRLEKDISATGEDMSRQINVLKDKIEANRRLIDDIDRNRRYYYYPRQPYLR
jgi:hypothetical protein